MNVSKVQCFMVKEPSGTKQFIIDTPPDALKLLVGELHMDQSPVEEVYCLHLNSQKKVISYELISRGNHVQSDASPNLILRGAIMNNANAIILAHNHPSGMPQPSDADRKTTRNLVAASKLIGVPLLDHFIIGSGGTFTSLRTVEPDLF